MNLQGAIVEHQNSLLRFYRKLEERFEENGVIRTLWHDMAGDVSLQIQGLKSFPPSIWNQFKNAPDNGFESAVKEVKETSAADMADISLRDCFEISLRLAEPVVLKIYARLIRTLRKNSTTQVLNFYILVKAYVARLVRTTESFAGDTILIRRAQLLLAGFEKEVQEPIPEIKVPPAGTLSEKTRKSSAPGKADGKAAKETKKAPPGNVKASASSPAKAVALNPKKTAASKPAKAVALNPKKTVASKPAKAVPVKTKALPGKSTAKTKRAK